MKKQTNKQKKKKKKRKRKKKNGVDMKIPQTSTFLR